MMRLDRKTACPPTAIFDVPHKSTPMTAAQLVKKFPFLVEEFDGCGEERCLLYFWKRNKETKVYEFIDAEAELDVAEILNVELYDEEKEKEEKRKKYEESTRALTQEEIDEFKKELDWVRGEIKKFNQKQ